jgi:hypothetical protein
VEFVVDPSEFQLALAVLLGHVPDQVHYRPNIGRPIQSLLENLPLLV